MHKGEEKMTWKDCFEKYHYESLLNNNKEETVMYNYLALDINNRETIIQSPGKSNNNCNINKNVIDLEFFWDEENKPVELREIYISTNEDELFIILQPEIQDNIIDFCKKWDTKILKLLNFGNYTDRYNRNTIIKLRYNIVQIILVGNDKKNEIGKKYKNIPSDVSIEKSTSVSRKVFIECGDNDVIDEDNMILLPFWYDKFINYTQEDELERKLSEILPARKDLSVLYEKHEKVDGRKKGETQFSFTDDEFNEVKRWLVK